MQVTSESVTPSRIAAHAVLASSATAQEQN